MGRRRDSGFFTFGQICRFIHRLASRCAHPTSFPVLSDWFGLLAFDANKLVLLPVNDFLKRLKLRTNLETACSTKAERDCVQKSGSPEVISATERIKGEFAFNARGFILSLLQAVQNHISFSSDITKGLASFDGQVLFCLAQEQASRCFADLYDSFRLRKWVPDDCLSLYRDEYLAFLDHLRVTHSDLRKDPSSLLDLVDFLSPNVALRSRPHLLYLFELACLCLTENSSPLEPVKFCGEDTSDYRCRYVEVLQPVQSYLSRVPDGVSTCTNDSALSDFTSLLQNPPDFSSASYDPWGEFDLFGRKIIYKCLDSSYKAHVATPAAGSSSVISSDAVGVSQLPFSVKPKRVIFGGPKIPKKGETQSVEASSKVASEKGSTTSRAGSSKGTARKSPNKVSARNSAASNDGDNSSNV